MARRDFTKEELYKHLPTYPRSYLQVIPPIYKDSDGWKISIQGKTLDDVKYLCDRLYDFLYDLNISFKAISQRGIDMPKRSEGLKAKEQSRKALTIYCPSDVDFKWLCEAVYQRTKDYKGWHDINTPSSYEHYAGGLFIRNDRDQNGRYIAALKIE